MLRETRMLSFNIIVMNKKNIALSVFTFVLTAIAFSQASTKAKPQTGQKPAKIDTSKFVLVEGGTYKMGTDQPVEGHEGPVHEVTVKSFWLAKTETTFDDYDKFCY